MKPPFPVVILFSLLLLLSQASMAQQSEEEKQIFQMYFEKKDLAISATRNSKPISRSAENITIVTEKEIKEMNAHTVAEVLSRIPGVFISFGGRDYGSTALMYLQGSEARHTRVMLDGITWNSLAGGNAETITIPIGIIKRIEVIKGPASSSWGSSLGGVVNIITKEPADAPRPSGSLYASYGKENSMDFRGEAIGEVGQAGYYLYAGYLGSDGLVESRGIDSKSVYTKIHLLANQKLHLDFTAGYNNPDIEYGDNPDYNVTTKGPFRNFFSTATLNANISNKLNLFISLYTKTEKFVQETNILNDSFFGSSGERLLKTTLKDEVAGINSRLVWEKSNHTMVTGVDYDHGKLKQLVSPGSFYQAMGVPEAISTHPDTDLWAVYLNDTINFGDLSITPGIRYDHHNTWGGFTSPSLGLTYGMTEESLLRVSMAKGFTTPPLSWTSEGGLLFNGNPDLVPESVISFQTGVEFAASRHLWVKTSFFLHKMEDSLQFVSNTATLPETNAHYTNSTQKNRREGFEIETQTAPIYDFSLQSGFSYIRMNEPHTMYADHMRSFTMGLRYNNENIVNALITGQYIDWDLPENSDGNCGGFIWDLNLNRKIEYYKTRHVNLFLSVHNIFDGKQYVESSSFTNPDRWLEIGFRLEL